MAAEVHAIWAHAGVNVVWQTARPTEALADTIVVLVQIRDSLPFATSEASQPLGVVVRVNDRLQHTIFIARSAVERLVDASGVQRAGYPFDLFYGRFVGRIVAHELGHLLLDSSQHCASGLMRERFTGRDVLTSSHTRYTLCDGERAALTRR
jgi:hypothetical protein